jgi:hypothetical protein
MTQWRDLDTYSPFARVVVEFMWGQRPPLQPAQFAARVGVRRQRVATWLSTDAVPPPPVVMQVARGMGMPVRDLLIAAGHATADDPLLDREDAWELVTAAQARYLAAASEGNDLPADLRQAILDVLHAARRDAQTDARAVSAAPKEKKGSGTAGLAAGNEPIP